MSQVAFLFKYLISLRLQRTLVHNNHIFNCLNNNHSKFSGINWYWGKNAFGVILYTQIEFQHVVNVGFVMIKNKLQIFI